MSLSKNPFVEFLKATFSTPVDSLIGDASQLRGTPVASREGRVVPHSKRAPEMSAARRETGAHGLLSIRAEWHPRLRAFCNIARR